MNVGIIARAMKSPNMLKLVGKGLDFNHINVIVKLGRISTKLFCFALLGGEQ
jgi:hypothetical protein